MTGRVHSFQSLGTVDGPGVRFVVFLSGCPLRCKCCHNPDTWDINAGTERSAEEIVKRAARYKEYFGNEGGITVSGGEPLLQAEFCREIFELAHKEGINTCLDTSGVALTESVKALLSETDRVLLDIKYTTDEDYRENVGCSMEGPVSFLSYINSERIPATLRQVIIPTVNDTVENALALKKIVAEHSCIDKVELLTFRKICQTKYDNMGLEFPFGNLPEPTPEKMAELNDLLNN